MIIAVEPALAGPGPISIRDWDSQSKRRTKQKNSSVESNKVTTNFGLRKTAPTPEPVEYAASDVEANEAKMSAEAMRDTGFETTIVEPIVVENASTPAKQQIDSLESPIAEPSNDSTDVPSVQQAKRLPIEEAANVDRGAVAALETSPNEVPHVLVPSVGGFEQGEGVELYTELTSEPIRGGQITLGDETISLNDATIDQLFEDYEYRSTRREMLRVSLEDCLRIALVQNLDIQIAEFDPQRNDGELMQARGEFDPSINLSSTYRESQTSPSAQTSAFTGGLGGGGSGGGLGGLGGLSGLGGGSSGGGLLGGGNNQNQSALSTAVSLAVGVASTAIQLGAQLLPFNQSQAFVIESEGWQHSAGASGKTHYGTEYELRLDLNVEEGTYSGGAFEWDGGLTLQLTQPLLKGRGKNANLARIRTAKNSRISSEFQLKQTVEQSLSEVIKTYWDLVGAYEQLRVAQRSLSNAEQLRNDNEQRFEIGSGNQLDVVQAKASVAERQGDVINQINQVTQTENRLKQLLDLRDEYVMSPARLVPTQQIPDAQVLNIDEESSIQRALDNKPDIQASMLEAENAGIELKRANNELLPDLDLQGSYFTGGRGDKKKDVFDGLERRRDETWSLGLRATIPITNRQARGSHSSARTSKLQADRRLTKAQQEAIVGVKNAIASVGSNRIAVEARAESRAYQETNVEKQETSLKLGATTSFEVLRTQEDLANAEAQEVQSRIELEKSLVDLELAEGIILESNGIEFIPPEQAEAVPFFRSLVPPAPDMN